ncbi:hypothetical protein [Hydrogenophaga sp.]|uniref:hypothetical protein n=1 Tax=Hydrogenophaga sp. TaxID=1904254 RepID=UPI003AF76CB4
MSQADITRLVVGEPFTLGMGRAVGQSLRSSDVSKSLQWRDGKWQGQKSLLSVLSKKKRPKHLVLPAGAGRRLRLNAWVIAALVGLAGTGVALGLLLQSREAPLASIAQPAAAQSLPLVQALENVRTVDQPFPTAPAESFQVIQTAEGEAPTAGTPSLPILAPAGVGATTASASAGASLPFVAPAPMPTPIGPAPELTSERSSTRAEARPPAKPAKEEPKPPAVLLDEMVEKPTAAAPAKPEAPSKAPSVATKPTVVANAAATPAAAPSAASPAALAPARGLIAITPDGKSAVFTDPATRLPKQFKVGDKLTSGDTIKSIDAAQGKVIAGTKEYSLD